MSEAKKRILVSKELYLQLEQRASKMGLSVDDALVYFVQDNVREGRSVSHDSGGPSSLMKMFEDYVRLDDRQRKLFEGGLDELKQNFGYQDEVLKRFKERLDK